MQTNCATLAGVSYDIFPVILAMLHINNNDAQVTKGQPG
jgi:hypothetical protein